MAKSHKPKLVFPKAIESDVEHGWTIEPQYCFNIANHIRKRFFDTDANLLVEAEQVEAVLLILEEYYQ